jgi:hypothetical protein
MPTFDDLRTASNENLWKALGCIVAVAPTSVAALTKTDVFSTDGKSLKALPAGWSQLGKVTEDMLSWARELEISEVRSGGEAEPGRSDVKSITKSLTTTVQEVNKTTLGLIKHMDLSAVTADASGIVELTEPVRPRLRQMRLVAIGVDQGASGERYRVRQFARARVTETGEETWQNEDDSQSVELTFTAYKDSVLGYSTAEWIGGNWDPAAAGFGTGA